VPDFRLARTVTWTHHWSKYRVVYGTHEFINEYEHLGLGMVCRLVVAINGDTPSLIANDLNVTIEAIDSGRQLRAKDENVDATISCKGIEGIRHVLDEARAGFAINDEAVIDIDSGATLQVGKLS